MADLKELYENLGCLDVKTFLQTGNVLFKSTRLPKLADAIEERFKHRPEIIVRKLSDLTKIIKEVIPDINILYIDAKKNEKFLLEILLKRFKNIKILVIEFDYDIDDRSKKLLKKNKFSIIEKDSVNNYLIVNNRILN